MNKGYVALMSVLVISAVGTVVAVSLLTVGTISQNTIFTVQKERSAESLSQACVNVALEKIRLDAEYAGDEVISFGINQCDILPIDINGETYTIRTTGLVDTIVRKSRAVVVRTEDVETFVVTLALESWSDVMDF